MSHAVVSKAELNEKRYPVDKARGSGKKYDEQQRANLTTAH